MKQENNLQAFLTLVRAGLWEQETQLSRFEIIDYSTVFKIAEEQSVVGLVAAGLERVIDIKVPKEEALQFAGNALKIEQRNIAMNDFLNALVNKLREKDIYAIVVKGQGIAQCYERPLWRACGDIDFLLSHDNYTKAKSVLLPLASTIDDENENAQHIGMTIRNWTVELHGTLRSSCLPRMDKVIDEVQKDVFYGGNVRTWINNSTPIFLPSPDNDVFFVFTHIIKHFFHGGIGLRQVCDWSRLLWTYKSGLNSVLLAKRLREANLMTEWKAFASLAVIYLGVPKEAMPLYSSRIHWRRKADKILLQILKTGNFGHNRDSSYYQKYPFYMYKMIAFWRNTCDSMKILLIFPLDSIRAWSRWFGKGMRAVVKRG